MSCCDFCLEDKEEVELIYHDAITLVICEDCSEYVEGEK